MAKRKMTNAEEKAERKRIDAIMEKKYQAQIAARRKREAAAKQKTPAQKKKDALRKKQASRSKSFGFGSLLSGLGLKKD